MAGVIPTFGRLLRQRSSVAALDFALIAPVMLIFLFGTIELIFAIRMQAKVNVAAGQLVELVAGQPSVVIGATSALTNKTGSLSDMCAGAAMNLAPFNTSAMQASIGSVTVGFTLGFVHPITDWTTDVSCGTTAYHAGQTTLFNIANSPTSLFTADGTPYSFGSGGGTPVMGYSAISVQVIYTYTNVLPDFLSPTLKFTAVAAARPRGNSTVLCTTSSNGVTAACPQNP
jgi:Flp pilus assembly protein TadG